MKIEAGKAISRKRTNQGGKQGCSQGNNRLLLNSGAYRPFKDVTQISGLSGNLRPEGVYSFESRRTSFDLKIGSVIVDVDNDDDGEIDERLVKLILENFDFMNEARDLAQKEAIREYLDFNTLLKQ